MQRYRQTMLVDLLINLTDEPISVYEESSGDICKFMPCGADFELPQNPVDPRSERFAVCYIVSEDKLREIELFGRQVDDIALVYGKSQGRNGREMSYLMWAADRSICVRLRCGVRTRAS